MLLRHYRLIMFIWPIMLLGEVCVAGMGKDEFLDYLEARDTSISSYSLDMQRANFKIAFDDYDLLKDFVKKANRMETGKLEPSDVIDELIQHVRANDVHRLRRIVLERGEHFKSTQTNIKTGSVKVRHYDGELYSVYSAKNGQLDIHPSILQVGRGSLSDFGIGYIGSGKTWPRPTITAFEQRPDGILSVHQTIEDGVTYATEYDTNMNLKYGYYLEGGKKVQESWFLGHDEFGGYSIPRVHLQTWPEKDGYYVWCYVLGDVKINCPLTSEDLSLGELPAKTLVVDYRFEPSVQWRYDEYRQAAANPDLVYAGRCKPAEMIQFLKNTRSRREALSKRDSRISRKAPPLHIREWLVKPPSINKWPPGRFTVLEFWNIWCGPCIASIPKNNELAGWVTNKGGLFVSIHSATEETSKIRDFLESHNLRYTVGLDKSGGQRPYWGSQTFSEYGISGIPSYVTIAKNGRVLSYKDLTTQRLQEILASEPDDIAQLATSRKDVRRLTSIPNGWLAADLEPNSQVQGRFFVFRAETPDLRLKRSGTADRTVESEWSRHTVEGQTVHEVLLTAKALDWGQTLKGYVALVAEYGETEELLTIPYELASKSLARYVSPIIWFGPVRKGDTVTRKIMLQCDPQQKVKVNTVSIPSNLQLQIHDRWQRSNDILVECVFCSEEPGLQQGAAELLAFDSEGNEQPLKLYYRALALP